MRPIKESNRTSEPSKTADGSNRRDVLLTAIVAAGALAGAPVARADTAATGAFGAPLVELHVPAGVLSPEQKRDMIKGVTDVLVGAISLHPDQTKKLWVQIFETAEGGWGVGGQVFVPRGR
jgi:phenylpyruvate tautomerase PptA (4-oxalocrotonate tautomerase family)